MSEKYSDNFFQNQYGIDKDDVCYVKVGLRTADVTVEMKEKGLYYVIDFSDRIDPEAPKKMTVKIAKNNYNLREVVMNDKGPNVTLTVTKITHGCSDKWFKLDMNRYKNAVVVRK